MNLKEIREVINLMNENDLTEVEIEREGLKVKLKKSGHEVFEPVQRSIPVHMESQSSVVESASAASMHPSGTSTNAKEIQSPMVGTFYRAPSPEAPAFVEVGQMVEIGQVVCIVEAMKLMNEIKSEVRGKIVEIPVENAQPVEFSQILFVVEPI